MVHGESRWGWTLKPSDDRLTPPEVMEPLTIMFGKLFDPCPYPKPSVDYLEVGWDIKNFVNPPYSQIRYWASVAVREAEFGRFTAFLIPNDCSTLSFRILRDASWGRWEIPFRVKFIDPHKNRLVDVARSHVVFFIGGLP